ncbi:MAG: DHH family phosphoesterase [Tissierellia bacterium]|nr:DHH family phosphoesterase [Tissierellia bacterium]
MREDNNSLINWLEFVTVMAALVIMSIVIFIYHKALGAIAFAFCLYAGYYFNSLIEEKKAGYVKQIESMDETFSDVTRCAVFGMPFPMSLISQDGKINWYNTKFKNLFPESELLGEKIDDILPKINTKDLLKSEKGEVIDIDIQNKNYQFYYNIVDTYKQDKKKLILIYGLDNTEDEIIKRAYYEETPVIMAIQIDNFEEIAGATDENNRPIVFAEIDKEINTYAVNYNGFARKYDSDKYLCVFRKVDFNRMIKDKFPIVEKVKDMEAYSSIPPTLSIGVGASIEPPLEVYKIARLAVDVALGRGGDQIVVNEGGRLSFYGGKKKAIEKHNKVKSRVISHALTQLVDQSNSIFAMGHKNPDMDSFGSCLGIYTFIKLRGKNCKIVLKEVTPAIESLYNETLRQMPEIKNDIISPEEAIDRAKSNSLVVVLDNHRKNSTEAPELLDITNKVVLIDHHRRGADYIEDPTLTYLEPYASSASELVTELIQYNEEDLKLPKIIADALLAGITVDTKSFTFQTGVRTFEAASLLKRFGADSISVKKLFREPADTVKYRSEVVSQAEIYKDIIAISKFENEIDNSVLVAAQSADIMLDMRGIEASFVLTYYKGKIHVSGRSVGEISVQIILEKIGGGGHQTSAGAQLSDMSIDEAVDVLKKVIDEYLEEDEKVESNIEK